jgi:hypothetical protein
MHAAPLNPFDIAPAAPGEPFLARVAEIEVDLTTAMQAIAAVGRRLLLSGTLTAYRLRTLATLDALDGRLADVRAELAGGPDETGDLVAPVWVALRVSASLVAGLRADILRELAADRAVGDDGQTPG